MYSNGIFINQVSMFNKEERSGFAYWFAHWCAFQMTALNNKCWKPKFLFHDIEKPWLKLWYRGNYKKVQKIHRNHNSHHIQYYLMTGKVDWLAMVIDWECSRFTKAAGQLNARETLEMECNNYPEIANTMRKNITPILDKLNI